MDKVAIKVHHQHQYHHHHHPHPHPPHPHHPHHHSQDKQQHQKQQKQNQLHHQHHQHHQKQQHHYEQQQQQHHYEQQQQQHQQQHQHQHQLHQQHQLQLQQQQQQHYLTSASSSSSSTCSSLNSPLGCQLAVQNKRKEKARIAARARRSQEASIILEMANELHITQEKIRRIDKATIVKLAIDYIKAFKILCRFCGNCRQQENGSKKNILYYYTPTPPLSDLAYPAPKLSTGSIFAPKTNDIESHFLMINERDGKSSFELKPDDEILDEDDLTHLAPQAGDMTIPLEAEPLDGIVLDTGLFLGTGGCGAQMVMAPNSPQNITTSKRLTSKELLLLDNNSCCVASGAD